MDNSFMLGMKTILFIASTQCKRLMFADTFVPVQVVEGIKQKEYIAHNIGGASASIPAALEWSSSYLEVNVSLQICMWDLYKWNV